jgi:hypothetical protein
MIINTYYAIFFVDIIDINVFFKIYDTLLGYSIPFTLEIDVISDKLRISFK